MSTVQLDRLKRLIEALDAVLDVAHEATFNLAYRTGSRTIMRIAAKIPYAEELIPGAR